MKTSFDRTFNQFSLIIFMRLTNIYYQTCQILLFRILIIVHIRPFNSFRGNSSRYLIKLADLKIFMSFNFKFVSSAVSINIPWCSLTDLKCSLIYQMVFLMVPYGLVRSSSELSLSPHIHSPCIFVFPADI